MEAIVNGRILLPDGEISGRALVLDQGVIREIVPESQIGHLPVTDAGGLYISPGFVDTHIHGYGGDDASDGDPAGILRMARALPENGVTAFLPTAMTVAWPLLESVFASVRSLMERSRRADFGGAEILGCHAEGPFINPAKKGAQAEENILAPDAERLLPYADVIRIVTCAPEMPGGEAFIRAVREKTDIRVSIGHSCATYDQAMAAIALGAGRVTHLFNAMPPLHHRNPGAVGAAMRSGVYAELIADTFHVHPGLFPMLHAVFRDRLVLITDATRAAGMPDGEYTLGGQAFLLKDGQCRLPGGALAGSALKMNDAVRLFREHAGIPLHAAVRAASLNAARSVGLEGRKGSLEAGKDADVILMDENCRVRRTIVRGKTVYEA